MPYTDEDKTEKIIETIRTRGLWFSGCGWRLGSNYVMLSVMADLMKQGQVRAVYETRSRYQNPKQVQVFYWKKPEELAAD